MEKQVSYNRFIKSNWVPLLCGLFFALIFYITFFFFNNKAVANYNIADIANKYKNYIPAAYALLSIIILYLLYFIKWIVRLNYWIANFILILVVFGFNLVFGVQLVYYEPRYTAVAMFIIDNFGKPMMFASIWAIILSVIFIFIKKKSS